MNRRRLVIDSSPLNYFARSNQLAVLEKLLAGHECFITSAVEEEPCEEAPGGQRLGGRWRAWLWPPPVPVVACVGRY